MYLTSTLARPQGQEENGIEGQMLQGGLFNWFKMTLVSWCKNQGEVPGGDSLPAFGSVSVETIQETSEIFINIRILMSELPSLSAMSDL